VRRRSLPRCRAVVRDERALTPPSPFLAAPPCSLRLLRRLAKRFRLACTSLLHRPTDRSDPVATPSLDPPAGAGQDSDALPLSSVLLLDGQEQLGDLPDHLKYDPVRHARADLPAYSYITEEVWRCIGEQAAGFYFPEGDGADDIVQFYVSVLMVTDEVKCILPPSLERDHSINTMRKLARDMLNDPFLRHMGYFF